MYLKVGGLYGWVVRGIGGLLADRLFRIFDMLNTGETTTHILLDYFHVAAYIYSSKARGAVTRRSHRDIDVRTIHA